MLTSLLLFMLLAIFLPIVYYARQPLVFPHGLKPVVFIENAFEITIDNYVYFLNYSYVLNSGDEVKQWLEERLSRGVPVYLLELKIYIENRSEKDPVTVYTSGCTGFMRVKQAYEGEYFIPEKSVLYL